MNTTEFSKAVDGASDRLIRELASDLAYKVRLGEMTELEANQMLSDCQDRWSDCPWG